jgi:peptide/nickel transport system permease protein
MVKYIIKRLLMMIPIILAVAIIIFTLMSFVPGDPATIQASGQVLTEEQLDAIRESMGLNEPFLQRLVTYLKNVFLHLDFGVSYQTGSAVGPEILTRFWTTFRIAVIGMVLMVVIGIPIGIRSAVKANTLEDRMSMFITLIGNSMPLFWLALMLALLFSLKLKWLPSYGSDNWKCFVLPCVCVALEGMAGIARQTRSSMLEVIRSDYITTAWSKGLPSRKVIYGHALPNALIPIITVIGSQFGRLIGGVVVVETIFSIRGLSVYLLNGINSRDYPVVQGCLIVIAFLFSMVMLIADLVYTFIDPRIKARYVKIKKESGEDDAKHANTGA